MMQTDAQVTDIKQSGPFVRVAFTAPAIASGLAPGRFVLAELDGYLRTPLFPTYLAAGSLEVLVPPDHLAATLRSGDGVNLIGPLGRGFEVPATARRLLLVADMAHLPILLPLAQPGYQGSSVALLLSVPSTADLYPIQMLPPELEIHLATADGSAGHSGSPLDLFPDLARWADCVCVAGDPSSYPMLAEIVREVRIGPGHHFAQALIVPATVCGVGACQGCAVKVAHSTKLACTDGPVFDLLEL